MTNVSNVRGAPPPPNPNSFTARVISTVDLPIGCPVTNRADVDGEESQTAADASVSGLAYPCGFLSAAGDAGGSTRVQFAGPLTLTAAQWGAIVGNSIGPGPTIGLSPHTEYYLSTTPGQITSTPPSTPGEFVVPVGRALSDKTLLIRIGTAVEVT